MQNRFRDAAFGLVQARLTIRSFMPLVAALIFLSISSVHAQEGNPSLLRMSGLRPVGPRTTVTEGWSTLQFDLRNLDAKGRDARVSVFYPERPDVQFARDVWVPAHASLTTWITVGPAPKQKGEFGREIKAVLYERVDGAYRPVLPPGDERVRSQAVPYLKREPTTALYADLPQAKFGKTEPVTLNPDLVTLARIPRYFAGLSDHVSIVPDEYLPPTQESLDAVNVFIVAGNRLARESTRPRGVAALGPGRRLSLGNAGSRRTGCCRGDPGRPFRSCDRRSGWPEHNPTLPSPGRPDVRASSGT